MTTITLKQVKEEIPHNIYNYFKVCDFFENNNLDGKDLNTIARTFFKDGESMDFFFFVEVFNLEQYLDEYKDVLIENIDTKDEEGITPLHDASSHGNLEAVQFLIDNGADVNARNKYNETPLHYASYHGRLEIARLLVDNEADVNAKDERGNIPLYWASLHCNYKLMELLSNN